MFAKLIHKIRTEPNFARWAVLKALYRSGLGRFIVFNVRGMKLRLFSSAVCFEAFRKQRAYRADDVSILEQVLKPGDVVVDVGANVGFITLASAKQIGSSGTVLAIEPQRKIFGFLNKHIRLNALLNVRTLNAALGDHNGVASFNCDREDDRSRVEEGGATSVPMFTLDDALQKHGIENVDLLKIDVEGYELFVLQGANKTLQKTRYLYVETDAETYARAGYRIEDVLSLLKQYGFDLFVQDAAGKWLPATADSLGESNNVIARKMVSSNLPAAVVAAHS